MEHIKKIGKIIGLLMIVYSIIIVVYKLSGTHIYKLDTNISKEIDLSNSLYSENIEFFVIQNPPSTDRDVVELIRKFNKKNGIDDLDLDEPYIQVFYKESWTVNRFFEPFYSFGSDTESNLLYGTFPDKPKDYVVYVVKPWAEEKNNKNHPITPYFKFYKVPDWKIYTPNGTKQNHNDNGYDPFVKTERAFER